MSDKQIRKAIKDNPELNSTELAQKLADGYKGNSHMTYVNLLLHINKVKYGEK